MSDHDDRRNHPRIEKCQLVQVSRFDEEGFRADLATGRTLNISRGGLRLELVHPLPLRSEVSLSLALGNDPGKPQITVATSPTLSPSLQLSDREGNAVWKAP